MILAADCGNTQTVLGCIDEQGTIVREFRIESNRNKSHFEYASDIDRILRLLGPEEPRFEGAILSSVVPGLTETLRKALRLLTGRDSLVVGAGIRTGLRIRIDDPGSIASDLVATAVAAKQLFPLPAIIIDMGTATTVTVVDREGSYIGGVIMPGVRISMNALAGNTSLLPSVDLAPPRKLIATATGDAIRAGLLYGAAGALDGILHRFEAELDGVASIVATGGLAASVCPYCTHPIRIDEQLLLRGLYLIWRNNRRG